jgi:transposase
MVRKHYAPAQKATIVLELFKEEETLPQVAWRHGIHPNLLRKWKAQASVGLPNLFTDDEQDKRALESERQRRGCAVNKPGPWQANARGPDRMHYRFQIDPCHS